MALALPAAAQSHSIKADRTAPARYTPAVGERLNYDVSWADFIVAGELTLETKDRRTVDGVDAFHVSAQAQSIGLVSVMAMKVNDVYESFLNASTLMPFRAEKSTRHGKKQVCKQVAVAEPRGEVAKSHKASDEEADAAPKKVCKGSGRHRRCTEVGSQPERMVVPTTR